MQEFHHLWKKIKAWQVRREGSMGVKGEGANSVFYCVTSVHKFSIARKFSKIMTQTIPAPSTAMRCETQSMMQVLGKAVAVGGRDKGWWNQRIAGGKGRKECFWVTQGGCEAGNRTECRQGLRLLPPPPPRPPQASTSTASSTTSLPCAMQTST